MIIVFDIGTTVIKGGILNVDGDLVVHSRQPIAASVHPGFHHGDTTMEQWVNTFIAVSRQCIREFLHIGDVSQVEGVVISGNGPTFIPVDAAGHPLPGIISWADKQSRNYIPELNAFVKGQVNPAFYLSKAYSLLKLNQPLYEQVKWFLPCPEFFSFYLTGIPAAFLPAPGFTAFMWTKEAIAACGMDAGKFPPFIPMGEEIGKVKPEICEITGIPRGIPVFAGGPDFIMSLLGTGTISPGRVCDRTGTSEGINICSKTGGSYINLITTPHIRESLYNVSSILPFAGKVVDWFLRLTGKNRDSYGQLYDSLKELPPGPGNILFLPHLDCSQPGMWPVHRKGIFIGLSPHHGQKHLFKAIIEGLGYAVRDVFELFHRNGFESEEVRVSGILASHDGWNKIRANILGKKIRVPVVWDTELMGAASIGYASLGHFSDYFEGSEQLVRFEKEYAPDKELVQHYNDRYDHYSRLYGQTDELLQELQK